jgi:hypothetical protein
VASIFALDTRGQQHRSGLSPTWSGLSEQEGGLGAALPESGIWMLAERWLAAGLAQERRAIYIQLVNGRLALAEVVNRLPCTRGVAAAC